MSKSAFMHLVRLALLGRYPSVDNGGYDAIAEMSIDWMEKKGVPLQGRIVLDLGGGTGVHARHLAEAGARVIIADLRVFPVGEQCRRIRCDALSLALSQDSVDTVYCSNLLEHIPLCSHSRLLDEIHRVLHPGGYVYLCWSNWLSPFGGHEHSPFHYLGNIGIKLSRWLRGLRGQLVIHQLGINLFRTHIGSVVRETVSSSLGFHIVDMVPRYWPWLSFMCRVPGVREFLTWNCVILLEKARVGSRSG